MGKTYSVTIQNDKLTKKKKRSNKKSKKLLLAFILIFICLSIGGYFLYGMTLGCEGENCSPILKPIIATIEPKLQQKNGLTNILIVGLDTRDENSGLMNTDTIIILTIDHDNKTAMMTSIPRDFWVKYQLPNGNFASSKINGAYANGEWQEEGTGVETLKGVVEDIFGEEMHYYVKVTLKGFVEIIDAIGGVDIDIPEYYKDAYPASELPPELQATCAPFYYGGKYCLFEFQEGVEHMDGERALIYARCRLLSQRGDFDRAQRQQRVISAVKDKILSSETLTNPQKLWEIYQIIQETVETSPFTINDLRAGLNLKDEIDIENIGHVVLDPYFGNEIGRYIYVGDSTSSRGYHIIPRDDTFGDIREMLNVIMKFPGMYDEAPIISIYNATGVYTLDTNWAGQITEDNPIVIIKQSNKFIYNTDGKYTGVSIYKFTQEEKPKTEEYLKEFFEVDEVITEAEDGTQAYGGEDYIVVIGKEEPNIEEVEE